MVRKESTSSSTGNARPSKTLFSRGDLFRLRQLRADVPPRPGWLRVSVSFAKTRLPAGHLVAPSRSRRSITATAVKSQRCLCRMRRVGNKEGVVSRAVKSLCCAAETGLLEALGTGVEGSKVRLEGRKRRPLAAWVSNGRGVVLVVVVMRREKASNVRRQLRRTVHGSSSGSSNRERERWTELVSDSNYRPAVPPLST